MTPTQRSAYVAPMHETSATPAPEPSTHEPSPGSEWRALWDLEDWQPAWEGSTVAALDGALQGEMGHS